MENYSVLFSLYAKENPDFLKAAVDSMLNQTAAPDQIVIVLDGELTSALYGVLDEYEKTHPNLFTFVKNEKNLGLGLSLNRGLEACRNELVARMDTDDVSKPERCEKQLKVFEDEPDLSIVGAYVDEFEGSIENVISTRKVPLETPEIYAFNKRRSAFNHPAVMYKKSAVLSVGGYGDLRRNQDVDLFGRMMFSGLKAKNIPESLLYFRTDGGLATRRKSWANTKTYIDTIKKFYKMGYSGFFDFVFVAVAQTAVFLMPSGLQKFIYKKFLRK